MQTQPRNYLVRVTLMTVAVVVGALMVTPVVSAEQDERFAGVQGEVYIFFAPDRMATQTFEGVQGYAMVFPQEQTRTVQRSTQDRRFAGVSGSVQVFADHFTAPTRIIATAAQY